MHNNRLISWTLICIYNFLAAILALGHWWFAISAACFLFCGLEAIKELKRLRQR